MKAKRVLTYAIMAAVAALWIMPFLWMIDTAFKPDSEIFANPPRWIPSHFTLDHLAELFREWPYFHWLLRSLAVALMAVGGSLLVSTLAAFSFSRLRWKGRDTMFLVLLVFMLLPWQVNMIPLFFTMKAFGFLNTVQGVALPIIAMPIGVFLLRQFFINIPKDLEDAARIDGCSSLGVLLRVIVPISRPAFGAYGVFMFTWAWTEFFWSSVALQKPTMRTLPVGLRLLQGAFDIDYGLYMAASFMAAVPSFLIFLFLRRQIVRGFTLAGSGIKG
ncbi:MAG: carbohydrate ABC transporter permease [Spirochaetales bacterium]|nr:carbohydrate ABC transporter permease [Spirochaetales bacterium]